MRFGAAEIILVVVAILLLFGASRLPQLARSIGQSKKAFKDALSDSDDDDDAVSARLSTPSVSDDELAAELRRRKATAAASK
ncbi:MAG TPA: twin-arginine translocase TatA/TatE family subunit [Pyrinomonadaceae bacterium]|nr:twin-arginine translocase TatA/TatE family subunit [Pyrinomonadaceae bacterium]